VDHLALVVSLLALHDILGRDSSLGKIDVTCRQINTHVQLCYSLVAMLTLLFVHTEYHDDLVATNSDELLDTSDTSSGKLREQNHAVDVIVL
jgi:hypothetical protein